jgi:hypothetical protein
VRGWRAWLATAAAAALVVGTALGVTAREWGRGPSSRGEADGAAALLAGALTDGEGAALAGLPRGALAVAGAQGATVTCPSRWTVAARAAATLRREAAAADASGAAGERVTLVRGTTLWHVVPGRGAVEFDTPHARVQVLGTVLLVDVEEARTTVAVYDGRVQVVPAGSPAGDGSPTTVEAGRAVAVAADRAPVLEAAAPAPPDWLPASAAPQLALAPPAGPIAAGRPAWCRVTLTNPGPGCAILAAPNARDPLFSISLAGVGTTDRGAQVLRRLAVRPEVGGPAVVAGFVVLGPGASYAMACDVGSGCTAPGRFELVARYVVGTDGPAGTFVGSAAAPPTVVEVRAP